MTKQPLRGRVHRLDYSALVDGDDAVHCAFKDSAVARFAVAQCLLASLTLCNIAHDPRENAPIAQAHFADGQVDWKYAPIAAAPHNLTPDTDDLALAGFHVILQVLIVLFVKRTWHQHFHVLPKHFVGNVAEDPLRGRIQRFDLARFVDRQNPITRGVNDRAKTRFVVAHRLLGRFALGEIPGDFGKPQQLSPVIEDAGENHAGPETRPVLSNAPAFVLATARFGRGLQLPLGFPFAAILRRVKAGEIATQYFASFISFYSLRARVPCDNVAFGIQDNDRVVPNGLHDIPPDRI